MDSKSVSFCIIFFFFFFMVTLCGVVRSDMAKDRAECADQLVGLAPCLPYVSGDAKLPTPDCCTGIKGVVEKSKKCLCILVKDRDDPSLGFKINATLALSLPDKCHAPANISQCPDLLHLAHNSPDAKIFEDFNKTAPVTEVKGSPSGEARKADDKSDVGKRKRWLAMELFVATLIHVLSHL
ncbi:PREDICTED: protein YLS3-like [Ipomoea nil]|uniref:protein YLS3-like n=1 Tax=Ipomoea nil TaxID=35883 RepID=UPI000900FD15|nr:PREDICTED: protein YLS3-like [Ipomoea nil]